MTKNWLHVKDRIRELYVVQGKSLAEVARQLRDRFEFIASTRAYRIKLREWGFKRARCRPASSPALHITNSPKLYISSRTASPGTDSPYQEIPDEVVLEVLTYIREANLPPLQEFFRGPLWHLTLQWHIDFSPGFHERRRFQDFIGRSLLSAATFCSSLDVIRFLLSERADVNLKDLQTCSTPLMVAIQRSEYEIVKLLLEHNASKALLNSDGYHALHVAASFAKDIRIMELLTSSTTALLDAPAGEGPAKGTTALDLALTRRLIHSSDEDHAIANQIARCLLRAGAHIVGSEILLIRPWSESHTLISDDELLLLDFVDAGLDLQLPIDNLPDGLHLQMVPLGHALVFHSSEPGLGLTLARRVNKSHPEDKKHLLHTLCSGCYYNHDYRVEEDVTNAIEILLERGVDPNTVDSTCYTPLNCFLDSVAWYSGEQPKRLDSLRLLLEHGANPCHGDGTTYPVRQVLEGPEYIVDPDDEDFDYIFDVICLLVQYFPNDMRGAPRWQREHLRGYLPVASRYMDYGEKGYFEEVLQSYSGLSQSSVTIFRRAAQTVSMRLFLHSEISLAPSDRNHAGILHLLTLQRAQGLPSESIPRQFVIDLLTLLTDQGQAVTRQVPDNTASEALPNMRTSGRAASSALYTWFDSWNQKAGGLTAMAGDQATDVESNRARNVSSGSESGNGSS